MKRVLGILIIGAVLFTGCGQQPQKDGWNHTPIQCDNKAYVHGWSRVGDLIAVKRDTGLAETYAVKDCRLLAHH